jgi:hypothetical protein
MSCGAAYEAQSQYPEAIYLGLGEREQALNWLDDSYPGVFPLMLKTDSRLDELRAKPRFVKVLQRMGLKA